MTSTPAGTSKGKGHTPTDWHLRALDNVPTSDQLSALELPMNAMPEQKDTVPTKYTGNVQFLVATQEGAPWTGYFATWRGAKIAVSNIYGVWFEICRRGEGFEAHHLAQPELALLDLPLLGIDFSRLHTTGEPFTRPPSRAAAVQETDAPQMTEAPILPPMFQPGDKTFYQAHVRRAREAGREPERFDEDEEVHHSSTTNIPPCRPGGTGDDPMTLGALTAPQGEYLQ